MYADDEGSPPLSCGGALCCEESWGRSKGTAVEVEALATEVSQGGVETSGLMTAE